MYLDHYGLKEAPFSITPDPRYVFLSERHRDALAHLLYGVGKGGSGGFVQLTGEVGTGKTTLCRLLLEQLPENTRVALILNPKLSPLELLQAICEELRIPTRDIRGSQKGLVDALNAYLLDAYAQGLRVVLIVDEAQNLSIEALEQIRLLTNLETPTQKLLQIILLGQPELRDILAQSELRQLNQRITARYHLKPLDEEETATYVRHRLAVAGLQRMPFSRLGVRALYQRSEGVPRVINIIADRALTAGFALDRQTLGERLVQRAADEALPGSAHYWVRRLRLYMWLPALALLVLALLAVRWWMVPTMESAVSPPVTSVDESATSDSGESYAALERAIDASAADADGSAWAQLLARWQVRSGEATVEQARACPPVVVPGFGCLAGNGTLEQVERFDRPLILQLQTARGTRAAVLLLGTGSRDVRVEFNGNRYQFARSALLGLWHGEFVATFRLPPRQPQTLQLDDGGPGVAWVARQLDRVDGGVTDVSGPIYFDAAMKARVMRLQQGFGLRADGIVGLETLFALSSIDADGPHLARDIP